MDKISSEFIKTSVVQKQIQIFCICLSSIFPSFKNNIVFAIHVVISQIGKGLSPLEERSISPRLPFMVIKSLKVCRQNALKVTMVNVPIPLANVVTSFPEEYSYGFMAETIRPS